MSYSMASRPLCKTHPGVDYKHAWGCPECVRELRDRNAKLTAACELILIFHGGHTWSMEMRKQWDERINALLTPTPTSTEATTKNLCNAVRAALTSFKEPHEKT